MGAQPGRIWKSVAWRIAALATLGLFIGSVIQQPWPGLSVGLAVALLWQLRDIARLEAWLTGRRGLHQNRTTGPWQGFYDNIYQRHRDRREQARELQRIIGEFRDASHALPDAIVVIDDQNSARWFNNAALKLLGLKAPEDFGRPVTNLVRNPRFRRWLNRPSDEPSDKLTIVSPIDPQVKVIFATVALSAGRRLLTARDVTMIHRLDEMRRDFVANVSHELRTPLTVVSGYLEAMGESIEQEWQAPVDQMTHQCKRMKELIDDLLVIARLESGERSRVEQRIDMPELVKGLSEEAAVESGGNHEIRVEIESPANLTGVYKDLRVAFGNLVTNAIRYTPDGGTIVIRWREEAGYLTFSVTDNGPGIPSKFIPRLTERFYRIDSERSRSTGGTGLGLAIVKHVVTQHRGDLVIDSTVGTGSRFSCQFPADVVHLPQSDQQRLA